MRSSRVLFRFGLGLLALPVVPRVSWGQQILELYDASLTTYLPSGNTLVQDVRPLPEQRGVNIDGSLRSAPGLPMQIAGNPFGEVWTGKETLNGVRIDLGAYAPFEADIALPASVPWMISRSFNPRQETSGGSHRDSTSSPQGVNWFQNSQPEIVLYEHATDDAKDVLYVVYRADAFIELKRVNASSTQFKGKNGTAGVVDFTDGGAGPDTYTYWDQNGNQIVFFGFDGDAGPAEGQLWKIEDPGGDTAFVGDEDTASDAITNGFDAGGRILKAYDSTDRRFTYTYTTLDNYARLTEVVAETKSGGTWASPTGVVEVAKVEYAYYGDESYGDVGDLKLVTVTTPLDDSGVELVKKSLLRYWEGTYNATTNPGHPHMVKLVLGFEGARNYDWSEVGTGEPELDEGYLTASHSSLEPYAAASFEYDASYRIDKAFWYGECGCSGAGTGTHEFEYETNGSYADGTGYDQTWSRRTVVKRPDTSYVTQVFDETAQGLTRIVTDADPDNTSPAPDKWVTSVARDTSGRVTDVHTPANVTGYTHSSGAVTTSTTAGIVHSYTRASSGDMTGFITERKHKQGTSGSAYYDESLAYTSFTKTVTDASVVRPLLDTKKVFHDEVTADTSGYDLTDHDYTAHSGTLAVETVTQKHPTVTTGKNGSGSQTERKRHYRKDGRVDFEKSEDGIIGYTEYTGGLATKSIRDGNTALTGGGQDFENVTIPTGFDSSGTELHLKTTHTYTAQGSPSGITPPGGKAKAKTYRTRLADQRLVTLKYAHTAGSTYYGPVQYTVTNHAGKTVAQAVVALSGNETTASSSTHIDETDSDPITAADLGTIVQMTTYVYSEVGSTLEEERRYFDVPASGSGSSVNNYDPTAFGYDDSGRRWRVKEATGTIRRTVHDLHGRVTESWIGTNDTSFTGGEPSGTDNMVKTEALVHDGGADGGNGLLTQRTLYVEDGTTGQRVTAYAHDVRGNVLLETNPNAPHAFHKYDNMGRRVATGLFSSVGSIVVGTDDPTTETANRLALTQTFYDEKGQVWKTQRHKIDDADGSDDDNLQVLNWYDAEGRVIKTDGPQLTKTLYDRDGRVTHRFVLALDNDTGYTDVDDVTGDIVLEEHQTTYDPADGTVIMQAMIARHHDDYSTGETTGALDTNADGDVLKYTAANIEGRIQITGLWYDDQMRLTDRVAFGTYGGSDFDRDGMSAPARSDTALRTTTTYGTHGRVEEVADPKAIVTRYEYDDRGQKTKEIKNYDAGVNSGNPSGTADNVTVVYGYKTGLMKTLTADLPSGSTDQVTTYTYGTEGGGAAGDSEIATGDRLQEVKYPDSASASDVVSYAYNAQGQRIYTKDQAGNVIETEFDTSGRVTDRKATTIISGFDDAVEHIETTYDNLGRRQLVTQWDALTGTPAVTDEVKYTYDDWGNLEKFEQDRNSTVGASGSVDDYEISYAWEKATTGRNTLRRTSLTLPSGNVIDYNYRSTGDLHDDEASRVTDLEDGAVKVVDYAYNGAGQVVGTNYPETGGIMWFQYGSTSGSYPALDRFNRVVKSRWTRDLATDVDFYSVDITYDRNSNITRTEDNVHAGFDVSYTIDDLNRVTRAHEGTWSGSITSPTRDQQWTLDQVGNWDHDKVDLDGDGYFTGTDEIDDARTHNDVNELTARDIDDDSSDDYTLAYDAVGNMTDDGENYEYVWDVFGRLRKVNDTSDQSLVAEYRYNGLGYRIAVHEDTDDDGDVDGSDLWYYDAFDERWRDVARFRESDSTPKEEFLYHAAGADGRGGSSYIDLFVLRDADGAYTAAADGTLEKRAYYCQNWRADMSVVVGKRAQLRHWVKYSAYGVPLGIPGGDTDSDGDCDATDVTQIQTWIDGPAYNVLGDIDLDGDVDADDKSTVQNAYEGDVGGRGILSPSALHHKRGCAGLPHEVAGRVARARLALLETGMWIRRDPINYRDGESLYELLGGNPLTRSDPTGLYIVGPLPPGFQPLPWINYGVDNMFGGLLGMVDDLIQIGHRIGLCVGHCATHPNNLGNTLCEGGEPFMCLCPGNSNAEIARGNPGAPHSRHYTTAGVLAARCTRAHEERHLSEGYSCSGAAGPFPEGSEALAPIGHNHGFAYLDELECYNQAFESGECAGPCEAFLHNSPGILKKACDETGAVGDALYPGICERYPND